MLVGEEGGRWGRRRGQMAGRCQAMKKTLKKSGKGDASDRCASRLACETLPRAKLTLETGKLKYSSLDVSCLQTRNFSAVISRQESVKAFVSDLQLAASCLPLSLCLTVALSPALSPSEHRFVAAPQPFKFLLNCDDGP